MYCLPSQRFQSASIETGFFVGSANFLAHNAILKFPSIPYNSHIHNDSNEDDSTDYEFITNYMIVTLGTV